MNFLKYSWVLLAMACSNVFSQNEKKISRENVINKTFLFTVKSVTPMGGSLIIINSLYDIRLAGDSLISNLPYFGRAYSAPINPSEAGLSFTSTRFTYDLTKAENDKYEITIETKDLQDNNKLFFTLFGNGEAQLVVQPFNKQSIRYDGFLDRKRKE